MAAYTELIIEQNADFATKVNIADDQGDSMNLLNYTASSQMRKSYYTSSYTSFNVQVSNTSTGEITMTMNSAVTGDLTPGRYVFDLVIKDSQNTATRVIEGIVSVLPGVTRNGN